MEWKERVGVMSGMAEYISDEGFRVFQLPEGFYCTLKVGGPYPSAEEAKAAAEQHAGGWLPIDTAPKDGTEFLALLEGTTVDERPVYDCAGGMCDVDHIESCYDNSREVTSFVDGVCNVYGFEFGYDGYLINMPDKEGPNCWSIRIKAIHAIPPLPTPPEGK